jgi:hypothetical protein
MIAGAPLTRKLSTVSIRLVIREAFFGALRDLRGSA